ncbi:MAG: sigma-54 factor interaction domain-containing protein, partial [Pirellulaceae bacterium]|nr:sigma-54 factor interaction domain-containing protein [Pirellulaceae bacterium]
MSSNPINSPDSPVRPMVVDDIRRLLPSMHDAAGVLTSDPSTADRDASDQHESSELIDEIQAALTCAGDQSNEAPVAHESSPRIIAASNEMRAVMQRVTKVARSSSTALLTGESGVGKTTIAVRIHEESSRSSGPFVVVNCAALPRDLIESELFGHTSGAFTGALKKRAGRIEAAEGGTLFLDEVGDLPIELQPKLLTFLQDRSFYRIGSDVTHHANVRIIAATNRDPRELSAGDRFRPDLYYRLNVLRLHVPPL